MQLNNLIRIRTPTYYPDGAGTTQSVAIYVII